MLSLSAHLWHRRWRHAGSSETLHGKSMLWPTELRESKRRNVRFWCTCLLTSLLNDPVHQVCWNRINHLARCFVPSTVLILTNLLAFIEQARLDLIRDMMMKADERDSSLSGHLAGEINFLSDCPHSWVTSCVHIKAKKKKTLLKHLLKTFTG